MAKRETVIICMAVNGSGAPLSGCIPGTCSTCIESVWLAPTTRQRMLEAGPHRILCTRCANKEILAAHARGEAVVSLPLSPAQRAEIEAEIARRN